MQATQHQPLGHPGTWRGWLSLPGRFSSLGAALLSFAALSHPLPAQGTTLPATNCIELSWTPSASSDIVAYRLYCGTASGDYTQSITVSNGYSGGFPDLIAGQTYYFVVTALDENGNESPFSNEVSYTLALPTGQPPAPPLAVVSASPGQFVLRVSGQIGQPYAIEASQDLVHWLLIRTVFTAGNGSVNFTDTDAQFFPRRFYRIYPAN